MTKILVAEDDKDIRELIVLTLSFNGFEVKSVEDGARAVAEAPGKNYDLILMDVQMPEMDGIAATHEIRHNLNLDFTPRIVAMTANALVGDREKYLAAGMDDYLSKPVRIDELREVLQRGYQEISSLS